MDTHTDTAVATEEAPKPEAALDGVAESNENLSFSDALEQALGGLESGSLPETVEQPVEQEPEKPVEEKNVDDVTEELKSEPTENDSTEDSKKADVDPLDELTADIGDDWTPKAADRFKQLKTELKTNRSEMDQLRQTVKEQEQKMKEMSGLVDNQDIDQLKETLAMYEHEKSFSDLESTQAYQEAVTEPLGALLNGVNEIGEKYDVDTDKLLDIISMEGADEQDAAILENLTDMGDRDKAKLYRIIDELDPIMRRRDELHEYAADALNEARMLEEEKSNAKMAEDAAMRANVTRNVITKVKEKLPFLNGIENVNMSDIEAKASELRPDVIHPVDFAYNSVAAQILPTIVKEYITSRKEAETLMNKLAEYEEAEPTLSGSPKSDSGSPISSDMSFEQAISAALGS
tara:strand:- start:1022 stop:2236 length:1215 start_codon:yes stop_codon:yes gene_type:complete